MSSTEDTAAGAPDDGQALVLLDAVLEFRGPHWPLSNFYPYEIVVDDRTYPTVEHYFQAGKTDDATDHERIRLAADPAEAKALGRRVTMADDWRTRRVAVMRRALAAKFTLDSGPGQALLDTGHAALIEGNDWGDRYWGVSDGQGHNLLGTLLTERRGVLHHQLAASTEPT